MFLIKSMSSDVFDEMPPHLRHRIAGPDHLQLPGGEGGRAASAAADSRGSKDR